VQYFLEVAPSSSLLSQLSSSRTATEVAKLCSSQAQKLMHVLPAVPTPYTESKSQTMVFPMPFAEN